MIPSPLPKQHALNYNASSETSCFSAVRTQDGQLPCGWTFSIGEERKCQGIRLQEVAFPKEGPEETLLWMTKTERYSSKGREAAPRGSTTCFLSTSLLVSERCKSRSPGSSLVPAFSFPALFRSQPCVLWIGKFGFDHTAERPGAGSFTSLSELRQWLV